MFGLRQKLTLGFGGLMLIVLTVSGLGIAVLRQHRSALDKFLYENWRSVEYGQGMFNALEDLNENAKAVASADPGMHQIDLTAARASLAKAVSVFEKNLTDENRNITLPGEQSLADALTLLWSGSDSQGHKSSDTFKGAAQLLMNSAAPVAERGRAYAAMLRLSPQVKAGAQAIIQLNLDNMTPIEGQIKAISDNASRLMITFAIIGAALAALFIAVISRAILQPIQMLTRSAREIENGNLDLVVQVTSKDELHQLAEAFNSMAAKLREYRRTNRAKLVRTQQTTQNAINSLPDAVAILSPEGKVEMANTAAQRLFAMRPDAYVAELHADWLLRLFQQTSNDLKPIEPRGYESAIQVLDEGGGERFFLPHAVPIIDGDRQLLGVTVVLADVTHLRRLDEMKSGMLSVVSHELKTPMTSIRMGVHLLLEERVGPLNASQNDLLSAVREDSDRLNQIVENLLDMGRIESGQALLDLKPESARSLVLESTEPLTTAFHDRGVELEVDVPVELPEVRADRPRMSHVFSNLLSNALKYTPPGGRVTVSAAAENGDVRFQVKDTGPGIPTEHQPRIFERFFRVPNQSIAGAGLGLAIAKEIVHAHGGRIAVESRARGGEHLQLHVTEGIGSPGAGAFV